MASVSHMLFIGLYLMGGLIVFGAVAAGLYFWLLRRGGWHGN